MLTTFRFRDHIGVECNESKSSSTVLGVSWTDCIVALAELVPLATLLFPGERFVGDDAPIGSVSVVVFPPP